MHVVRILGRPRLVVGWSAGDGGKIGPGWNGWMRRGRGGECVDAWGRGGCDAMRCDAMRCEEDEE